MTPGTPEETAGVFSARPNPNSLSLSRAAVRCVV